VSALSLLTLTNVRALATIKFPPSSFAGQSLFFTSYFILPVLWPLAV
jgi:hypothetical protein